MGLNKNTAASNNETKAIPLTFVANLLLVPLQLICNRVLVTSIFPAAMKTARVTVLHKKALSMILIKLADINVTLISKVLKQ